ncbi:MAG: zeta toxin family protein [Fimbriimonadaceae bacterium]
MTTVPPQAVILAGPNGSGKTTCASLILTPEMVFVNADMIAQQMSGEPSAAANIGAGRRLIQILDALVEDRIDFAVETTLATRALADRILDWRAAGYQVHLFFFWLPSADLSVERVAARVRNGGHDVPESTIRRRFAAGLRNFFERYIPLTNSWRMYDNSRGGDPMLIASGYGSLPFRVLRPEIWDEMHRKYAHAR